MSNKKNILTASKSDSANSVVRVIEHSQFAKSALQQDKKYLPVAVSYSDYGAMRKELITPILPTNGIGRDRLHNIMRTVESSGTVFNEGRLVKLLSMMGSSMLAFHRNAIRYSDQIKDYAQFGPLNYIRYVTRVTNSMAALQKADAKIDYAHTNDYLLNVMLSQYVSVFVDYLATDPVKLSDKFVSAALPDEDYEKLRDVNSWKWLQNPSINSDYTLFFRVIGEECKQRTINWLSNADSPDKKHTNVLIELTNTLWVSIEDMALTIAGSMLDFIHMNRGANETDKENAFLKENFDQMQENMTFMDIFALGLLLSVSKAGDIGRSGNIEAQIKDNKNYEHILTSLNETNYGDVQLRGKLAALDISLSDDSKTLATKMSKDGSVATSILNVISSYINKLDNREDDDNGKFFAFEIAHDLLGELETSLKLASQYRDKFELYFTGMGGTIPAMLGVGNEMINNKLVQYIGVTGRDLNIALSELSNHIETIIDGRDSVAAYYNNMDSMGREAIKNLPELIREFDATCSMLSAKGNKTLATSIVDQFLNSEIWKSSGAQKIYANAYSYLGKPTDADSILQQMIIDDKVVNAFNDSVFKKFAHLKNAATIFPGHEFALGTNLTVEYDGAIKVTAMSTGSFVLNGINGYTDIFNLVTTETKDPKTLERLTNIYNIKLQQCLSDVDVHRDITRASSSTLSGHYAFSKDIGDTVLPTLQAIEAAIRYDLACVKYSIKANIAMYLLGNIDLMKSLKIAIEARELSFYAESGVERVNEMLTEMVDMMTKQLNALNISEARIRPQSDMKGMAPVVVGNSYDMSANLDSILSFFNIKANRIWYRDIFMNIGRLIDRIDQGRADGRNFVYLVDLDSKLFSSEYASLSSVNNELERLNSDVLANLLPSDGMSREIVDTTHRMYDRANFMYAVDLASTFSGAKMGFQGSVTDIISRTSNLPSGLDQRNVIPQTIINLLASKLNSKLTERYITSADADERLSRLYLMRGPATSSIMKLGTGFGEMAEYGISNEYHSKIAYSYRDALVKLLEDIGLHPDNKLMVFEVDNFCQYVRSMSQHPNFPLSISDQGLKALTEGTPESRSTDVSPYLKPTLSTLRIGDVVKIKPSIMRSSEDLTGTLLHINYYTRGEEVLKLLNSDVIEFRADLRPSLLAISLRDGLREFYMTQDEITLVEGHIPADIRYELSGVQALNIGISVVEALYDKIFNEKLIDDSNKSKKFGPEVPDAEDVEDVADKD